ncbi:enolase [Bacillus sp. J14TS2]|uniref:phosphopyruvate hydratase n=1 Tax=Bacillus sp. J14TS2 TaxID=2807188 RepID=UPI001B1A5A67|nr:phosphopyruvate hydratase [Bacillus sp. J14TS2]GIN71908.1 enolase [Bacillus sp. J14TS2]
MQGLIKQIKGREILDSRGNPTIEVDVITTEGVLGRAAVPSGASTGENEVLELRDTEPNRYLGKGVTKAIQNAEGEILTQLQGLSVFNQKQFDDTMLSLDGTENKSRLGANAILGVSLACSRAAAATLNVPLYQYLGGVQGSRSLPTPLFNIINGGAHADSGIDIQEFMIVPHGAHSFREAVRFGAEVYYQLKRLLAEEGFVTAVGDEGGFAPRLDTSEEAIQFIIQAIEAAGYRPGIDISIALDPAASEFFDGGYYHFEGKKLQSKEMVEYYKNLASVYPIVSIEDGLDEQDWEGWRLLTQQLGEQLQLVGDDIFVTNSLFLKKGILEHVANAILIKPNQIGTLTETLDTIQEAQKAGYGIVMSHRSADTEDSFISDLAVATNSGQIKAGSVARSERLSKYNQLIRIEEQL